MASQRRAPTKRPPRPPAKKSAPPLDPSEGTDAVPNGSSANGADKKPTSAAKTSRTAPKPAVAGKAGAKPAAAGNKAAGNKAVGNKAPSRVTKTAAPGVTKTGSTGSEGNDKIPATSAKAGPLGAPKSSPSGSGPSGPNYRPPTGATRSGARRPPPPPKRRKPRLTKRTVGGIVALALIATLVVFFSLAVNGSSTSGSTPAAASGPEQVAVPKGSFLAAVDSSRYPQTIDGISCNTTEQLVYHIHAHLTIFVNGQAKQVPYGIGIAPPLQYSTTNGTFVSSGACFYWLHTHAADGIMHIESPTQTTYTLGQFFDVWGQSLKQGQVGPAVGKLTIYVNGKPYTGDPRAIQLTTHNQIQLDVGSPAPQQTLITFPSGL